MDVSRLLTLMLLLSNASTVILCYAHVTLATRTQNASIALHYAEASPRSRQVQSYIHSTERDTLEFARLYSPCLNSTLKRNGNLFFYCPEEQGS